MKLFLFILTICITGVYYAQTENTTPLLEVKQNYSHNWQVYTDQSDFKIEYKFQACDFNSGLDKELLLLRVSNKTNQQLNLEWHIQLYYGDTCSTCIYPGEYGRTITVEANSIEEGICTPFTNEPLTIFSKFVDARFAKKSRGLNKFKLANLTTN